MPMNQALKGRHRFLADYAKACVALSGLNLNSILKPRVPEPAVRAPPPWALLHRACSALGIRLTLTRVPYRTLTVSTATQGEGAAHGLHPGLRRVALSALQS